MVITKLKCTLIIATSLHFKPNLAFLNMYGHASRPENAPRTFQRLINSVFQEALDHFLTVYLDDILIYSSSTAKHLQYIEWVLSKLRSNYLFEKPTKCEFGLTELEYLGHIISNGTAKTWILRKLRQFTMVGFFHQCQRTASVF